MNINRFHEIDWRCESYNTSKSLLCAELSEMVYRDISDAEKIGKRSQIVPCEVYQQIINGNENAELSNYMHGSAIESIFERRSEEFVTRGFLINDVLFIATRGTELGFSRTFLDDMRVNIDVIPKKHKDTEYVFHLGFYREALATLSELYKRIEYVDMPVYFVGHSLGGAVSAIMNALFEGHQSNQSYTYGMPKFCNQHAMSLKLPHAVLNQNDLITCIPHLFSAISDKNYRHDICSATLRVYAGINPIRYHILDTYIASIAKELGK